ncbi:hypothetical protein VTN77DRAFT_6209 [Rasamsonia byssochlamydoides]|uniref:uncharacterized protein n=1 Tax=Rasamsonia byssochlamydoides TaxID=89139 RepID=UPI003742FF64
MLNTSPPSMKHPSSRRDFPPPSNAKKGSSVRPQRPGIHHRKSASAHLPSHSQQQQPHLISKLGPGSGPASWSVKDDDDKPEMAASFLQFCAMCEKQITIPNNAVLYCSESCRRKDSCKPLSASFPYTTTTMSPSTTPPSSPSMSPRAIVPPMTPTGSSPRPIPGLRIPSDLHDAKADIDPTEWKPVISRRNGSSTSLASTEAWNYLSQFHGGDEAMMMMPTRRPGHAHRSSASLSVLNGALPSLTHSPSTATSSLNSNSDYVGPVYDFTALRPLPPRRNPSSSTSAGATKGVELVVPQIPPPAAAAGGDARSSTSPDGDGVWLRSGAVRKPIAETVLPVTSTLGGGDTSRTVTTS